MNIAEAILAIHPTAKFSVRGNSYNKIEWVSLDVAKPTEAELKAAWSRNEGHRNALIEIDRLEGLQTVRRMSEAMPDDAGGTKEGRKWLKNNREAISVARSKL